MASTAIDEIERFFSWNPPSLIPAPRQTKPSTASTSTRPPPFYDKHFTKLLVLKKVQRLPSLVRNLAGVADKTLKATLNDLPPLDEGFPTARQRRREERSLSIVVSDERAVAEFYLITTARYCLCVASTLALHPSYPEWSSLLSWSQSGLSPCHANTTGQLRFLAEGNEKLEMELGEIVESMDSKDRVIFEEVRKTMSPLATWEMKSLSPGSLEVMTAVPNLGQFSWTYCGFGISNKHADIQKEVDRVVVGLDAQAPPWQIPENRDDSEEINIEPQVIQSAATSIIAKGKKRKRDEEEEAYQNSHDATAQRLVQQAWAQAVRVDGTIIVLHSGNQELVCIRHRNTQTLYVSDVIEPSTCSDPGYGKLHVGIYIAAIQDTVDRRRQQSSESKSPGDGGDQDDQDNDHGSSMDVLGYCRVGHRSGHSGSSQFSAGRKGTTDNESVAIKKAIDVASNCNVILLYLQYGIYDSVNPASFLRCATPTTFLLSSQDIRSYGSEECLTIVLTSEIGWGATGVVHRGTLKPEICNGIMPLDVVVKLAFDNEQQDALRNEYKVYCLLKSKGIHKGIATVLGLFDDFEGCACALVLLYAGVSLRKSQGNLSNSDCKSALSTLKSIHRAGILHGDIRQANILIGDSGVTIIDFGHSEPCDDQGPKDRELARLRSCLRLEGKHLVKNGHRSRLP